MYGKYSIFWKAPLVILMALGTGYSAFQIGSEQWLGPRKDVAGADVSTDTSESNEPPNVAHQPAENGDADQTPSIEQLDSTGEPNDTEPNETLAVPAVPPGKVDPHPIDPTEVAPEDADIGEVFRFRGATRVIAEVEISPDGKRLAAASFDSFVRVWDLETFQLASEYDYAPLGVFQESEKLVDGLMKRKVLTSLTWTPDSKRVVVCGRSKIESADLSFLEKPELNTPEGIKILANIGLSLEEKNQHTLRAFDVETLGVWDYDFHRTVMSVAMLNDGKTLASGLGILDSPDAPASGIYLWDTESMEPYAFLDGHKKRILGMDSSPDGRLLASCAEDGSVIVWDIRTGRGIEFHEHRGPAYEVAFLPSGDEVITCGIDRSIRIWNWRTGESKIFAHHDDWVTSVAVSPDGSKILSGSADKTVRLWDRATGEELCQLIGHENPVWSVDFAPDGVHAASGGGGKKSGKNFHYAGTDDVVIYWRLPTKRLPKNKRRISSESNVKELATFRGHTDEITKAQFLKDDRYFVTASRDKSVRVWDTQTGEHNKLDVDSEYITMITQTPDSRHLVVATYDKAIRFWNLKTLEEDKRLICNMPAPYAMHFSDDMRSATAYSKQQQSGLIFPSEADGVYNSYATLWDLANKTEGKSQKFVGLRAVFSNDHRTGLATYKGHDNTGRLYRFEVDDVGVPTENHKALDCLDYTRAAKFSPDGEYFVTSCKSGKLDTIQLWIRSGVRISYKETNAPGDIVWLPDSKSILAVGENGSVQALAVPKLTEIGRFKLEGAKSVHFTRDGRKACSISAANEITLWECSTDFEKPVGEPADSNMLAGHMRSVISIAFSKDGKNLWTVDAPGRLKSSSLLIWNLETRLPSKGYSLPKHVVNGTLNHDATALVGNPGDGFNSSLLFYKTESGEFDWEYSTGDKRSPASVPTFSSSGRFMATIKWEPEAAVEVWVEGNKQPLWTTSNLRTDTSSLASALKRKKHSPLAVGNDGAKIVLLAADPRKLIVVDRKLPTIVLQGHLEEITAVGITYDDRLVVASDRKGNVIGWEIETGEKRFEVKAHDSSVYAFQSSPDGKTFASGGFDRKICVWNTNGEVISELRGHTAAIKCLTFSADGQWLASGAEDAKVWLWRLSTKSIFYEPRIWSDKTGKHNVQAKFVGYKNGKVSLVREDGEEVVIPESKLSENDQFFLQNIKGHLGAP